MLPRLTTLLVLALTFALVACGGEEEPTTPTGPDQGTPETGPTPEPSPPAGDTPLTAFDRIRTAALAGDFAALYDLLSADTRALIDAQITEARELIKTAEAGAPGMVEMAKGQLGDKFGFSYDDLMSKPARELGGKILEKTMDGKMPGMLTGEPQGEPNVEGDQATVTVKKPNGKMKDVEMVKEGESWALKYDM